MRDSWNTIVNKYPDKWVVLSNISYIGPDIDSAEIVCVKDDSEIIDYMEEHLDDNFIFRRTTEGLISLSQEENRFVAIEISTNVASQGKTIAEAFSNLKEALELFYEGEHDPIRVSETDDCSTIGG